MNSSYTFPHHYQQQWAHTLYTLYLNNCISILKNEWLTNYFHINWVVHRQGKRQKGEGIKANTDITTFYTSHLGLELTNNQDNKIIIIIPANVFIDTNWLPQSFTVERSWRVVLYTHTSSRRLTQSVTITFTTTRKLEGLYLTLCNTHIKWPKSHYAVALDQNEWDQNRMLL